MRLRLEGRRTSNGDSGPPAGCYYSDYLKLDKFLNLQDPISDAHEENLFITVHQSHELWFKLIIQDLNRVHEILSHPNREETDLARAISSLERVKAIQPMLLQKLTVLETMTPMEFLEFRDHLVPASGFQSWQFRIIEILLGLKICDRQNLSEEFLRKKLSKFDFDRIIEWEGELSLLDLTEKWLERLPWLSRAGIPMTPPASPDKPVVGFNWMKLYKEAVESVLYSEEKTIRSVMEDLGESEESIQEELEVVRSNRRTFESLFDSDQHNEMVQRGIRRFSQKALLNAIFCYLYRDLTALHSPFRFLTLLVEIDDGFTSWRYRHAQMAHRMIGRKMGTGATSGADLLLRTAQQNTSFKDLRNIPTFLIPTSKMPPLPDAVLVVLS
jgi:tryptophan 2,3-dioxygenase